MSSTHQNAPSWKVELSGAADRLTSWVEKACLVLASEIAHGLHKIGLDDLAELFSSETPAKS